LSPEGSGLLHWQKYPEAGFICNHELPIATEKEKIESAAEFMNPW
jgi:hypothetical protein